MVRAADRAHAIGATTIQVFADNPTAWHRRSAPPRELSAFRSRLAAHGIASLATHAAYLINLAGPEPDFWQRSIEVLAAELRMGARYGARCVNMHVGSHRGTGFDQGRRRLAEGVALAFQAEAELQAADEPEAAIEPAPGTPTAPPMLVLEDSAGGGDGMGTTVDELAAILESLDAAGAPMGRLGVCLDTAHLWGAGYDLSRPEVIDALLEDCDRRLGPERLAMIHLNDSRAALGSRHDRHEHIGAGRIGETGLRHLVNHDRLRDVPMYLETPGMDEGYDAINMDRVRLLVAGEPLPPLPPEAFKLRGSRAAAAPAAT
jgi:deoxyribonuclease-4